MVFGKRIAFRIEEFARAKRNKFIGPSPPAWIDFIPGQGRFHQMHDGIMGVFGAVKFPVSRKSPGPTAVVIAQRDQRLPPALRRGRGFRIIIQSRAVRQTEQRKRHAVNAHMVVDHLTRFLDPKHRQTAGSDRKPLP